jgi:hypothetical protein
MRPQVMAGTVVYNPDSVQSSAPLSGMKAIAVAGSFCQRTSFTSRADRCEYSDITLAVYAACVNTCVAYSDRYPQVISDSGQQGE